MGIDIDAYGRPHNIDMEARNYAYGFNYDDPHMVAQAMREELNILSPRGQVELISDTQRLSQGALQVDPVYQQDLWGHLIDTGRREVSVNTEYGKEPIAELQAGPDFQQRYYEPGVYEPGVNIDIFLGMRNCNPFRMDQDQDRYWRERGERIWERRQEERERDPDNYGRLPWMQQGWTPPAFHGGEHHRVPQYETGQSWNPALDPGAAYNLNRNPNAGNIPRSRPLPGAGLPVESPQRQYTIPDWQRNQQSGKVVTPVIPQREVPRTNGMYGNGAPSGSVIGNGGIQERGRLPQTRQDHDRDRGQTQGAPGAAHIEDPRHKK